MQFDVIGYDNQVLGQVEASNQTEAWASAGGIYSNILDVRPTTTQVLQEVVEAEKKIYTFVQPVRDGYYYIAVLALTDSEAFTIADSIAFADKTGRLRKLSEFNQEELVLESGFRTRMITFGYAHRFVATWPPPYHERAGHYGFLPD